MGGVSFSLESVGVLLGLVALLLSVGLGIWVVRLQGELQRALHGYRALVQDAEGHNLEQILSHHLAELQDASLSMNDLRLKQQRLEAQIQTSLQKVGLVRFNPFRDTGSDQSFSVALLDARGNGVVFSSLYGRQDVRVYAKPVQNGASSYVLSEEEEEAIRQAKQGSV